AALREAAGLVHPRVHRDHRHRPENPGQRDRHPRPPVRPAAEPPPAPEVDPGEDRLQEEKHPLNGEREPQHGPVPAHHPPPPRPLWTPPRAAPPAPARTHPPPPAAPPPRRPPPPPTPPPQPDELGQQHHRRQRDPQARQDDMEPQRGGHLRSRRDHLPADSGGSKQDPWTGKRHGPASLRPARVTAQ